VQERSSRALPRARALAAGVVLAIVLAAFDGVATGGVALAASPAVAKPNRFDARSGTTSPNHAAPGPRTSGSAKIPPAGRPTPLPVSMKPGLVMLDPVQPAHFASDDGLVAVDVPAGAVTAGDVSAAGGKVSLLVRQLMPSSGSNAGGSGRYTFGTYAVQALDAAGHPLAQSLRQPVSLTLHPGARASALDLLHVAVTLNKPLPSWVNLDPASALPPSTPASGARTATAPRTNPAPAAPRTGAMSRQAAKLDASTGTLSATALAANGSGTTFTFDTDAPVATFGKPDPFETNLSGGALTADFPPTCRPAPAA
jgi:hypothetical protein